MAKMQIKVFPSRKNLYKCKIGMEVTAKEFVAMGNEIYHGNLPEGAKEHHGILCEI